MEDKKIIDLFFARDEEAITETAKSYGKKLDYLSYGILKNTEDSKEAVNDTYLKTWNTIPPTIPTNFYGYIGKICRYLCFGILDYKNAKKRSLEIVSLSQELLNCIPDKYSQIEILEENIGLTLNGFLKTISKDSRLIFLRRYWFCSSISEIADYYNISQSKVKTTLHRTRNKLELYLEKEGFSI